MRIKDRELLKRLMVREGGVVPVTKFQPVLEYPPIYRVLHPPVLNHIWNVVYECETYSVAFGFEDDGRKKPWWGIKTHDSRSMADFRFMEETLVFVRLDFECLMMDLFGRDVKW